MLRLGIKYCQAYCLLHFYVPVAKATVGALRATGWGWASVYALSILRVRDPRRDSCIRDRNMKVLPILFVLDNLKKAYRLLRLSSPVAYMRRF